MYYKLIMSDISTDPKIERMIETESVFDAIDLAAAELDNPENVELIEAVPCF